MPPKNPARQSSPKKSARQPSPKKSEKVPFEPFAINFNEAETLSKQRALDAVRNQGMQQYRPKNQPRPQQPTNPELSSSATNEGPAAVDSHFVPPTAAEEEQGQQFIMEGLRRYEFSMTGDENTSHITTADKEYTNSLASSILSTKNGQVVLVPAWKTVDITLALLKEQPTDPKKSKILFIEPSAKLLHSAMSRFSDKGVLAVSVTRTFDQGVATGVRPSVCCTTSIDAVFLLKKYLKDLQTDPSTATSPLCNFSHFVVERAHQMSVETQFLLSLLKEVLLVKNASQSFPKIILSVASPQYAQLISYFGSSITAVAQGQGAPEATLLNCHEAAGVASSHKKLVTNNLDSGVSSVRIAVKESSTAAGDAVKEAVGKFNPRFVKNACENVLPSLLLKLSDTICALHQKSAATSNPTSSQPKSPLVVIYCDSKAPAFRSFEDKLTEFKNVAKKSLKINVKVLKKVDDVSKAIEEEDGASEKPKKVKKTLTLYLLVLGTAAHLTALEASGKIALAAVIDFGTTSVLSVDGDKNNQLIKQLSSAMGGDEYATSLILRNVVGLSQVGFFSCEWASQEQVELRALSAAGGLYIQLIPEEIIRPQSSATSESQSRVAVSPQSLLPPIGSIIASPRSLLTLLHVPVTLSQSPNLLTSLVYPTGTQCALNLLKSLGMVESEAPHAPTVIGEFVDRFPEHLTIEAGYLALVMASLGLAELGAAIAAVATTPITRMCNLSRHKYMDMHSGTNASLAKNSDLLTDTLYFLTEMQHRFKSYSSNIPNGKIQAKEKFTNTDMLTECIRLFQTIRQKLSTLTFVGSIADTGAIVHKSPSDLMADLNHYTVIAGAVSVAAYAHNAALVRRDGALSPLYFTGGERKFSINSFLAPSDTATASLAVGAIFSPANNTSRVSQIVVPRNYSSAQSPNGASNLVTNTVVSPNFFYTSLVALRPEIECLVGATECRFRFKVHTNSEYAANKSDFLILQSVRNQLNLLLDLLRLKNQLHLKGEKRAAGDKAAFGAHIGQDVDYMKLIEVARQKLSDALLGDVSIRDAVSDGANNEDYVYMGFKFLAVDRSNTLEDLASAIANASNGLVPRLKKINSEKEESTDVTERLTVKASDEDDDGDYFAKHGPINDNYDD